MSKNTSKDIYRMPSGRKNNTFQYIRRLYQVMVTQAIVMPNLSKDFNKIFQHLFSNIT